ncbi:MAG TPA: FAD-dependent oxidoreductase [Myxococcales bacterium]|nr:FAD-dependent oxidoreductase [Myxococcales bacterium]
MAAKRYVIVGSGMTAHAAAQGIRELDQQGTITMIGAEPHPPYARPPLSKALWKGQAEESVWLAPVAELKLLSGRRATSIDRKAHRVSDDRGESHPYDKLLVATGGTPRRLPFGGDGVLYFRTLDDYRKLRRSGRRAVVVGGGFIGSEIAAALSMDGREVTMIFPEDGVCARAFPRDLADFVTGYYREKGVQVLTGDVPTAISDSGSVRTKSGREIASDVIVAGLGIAPQTQIAEAAGLEVRDGIVVDEQLRTSDPDIFAAGDVARFQSVVLEKDMRVEHEDNANTMGRLVGQAMTGASISWRHVPMFYSDLFDLGYEAVGEIDSRLETVADWKVPFREGVVYYLRDGRVRGVLLWNTWGQVDNARALLAEPGPHRDLKGRLPR